MKSVFVKVIVIMGVLTMLFSLSSCRKSENNENSDKNEQKYFSSYTQEQRKEYVADYLKENYGLICDVSDVKQRQETAIKNEDYYFATAVSSKDEHISVWIDKYGDITDTVFMLGLQDQITECIVKKIGLQNENYSIRSFTEFRSIPSRKWSASDNLIDMLDDNRTFSYIWIFVNDAYSEDNNELLSQISTKLDFCNAQLYLYNCDNPQDVDINDYDLGSYIASMAIERR